MSSLIVEVCQIDKVEKHPNAYKLSIATIKGWNVIIGLDQYKAGDEVVYLPPDSILPTNLIEQYNLTFIRDSGRLRTIKLRGYISQGLILPKPKGFKLGEDVAKHWGITKYEPPAPNYQQSGNGGRPSTVKNPNTNFHKYSSPENIKHYHSIFSPLDFVVVTEKIHGTNFRAGKVERMPRKGFFGKIVDSFFKFFKHFGLDHKYEFVYGSHNVQLVSAQARKNNYYGEDVYGRIAKRYSLDLIIPDGYVIYGEIYGKGIQDLTYGLDDIDLVVFDVKQGDRYLDYEEMYEFINSLDGGLPLAPILYAGHYYEGLVEDFTDGKSIIEPSQIREGVMIKTAKEENHPRIGRKMLKSISVDYLTRKDGTEYH